MNQVDVAKALDWSASKVLRIESGQSPVATSDLVALMTLYGVVDTSAVGELVELARSSRRPSMSSRYGDALSPEFGEWLDYEAFASVIRQYESKLIPGPLQTDDYAHAIVPAYLAGGPKRDKIEGVVGSREDRAERLTGRDGPKISVIIDEAALRRGVGNESGPRDYAVMIEQLKHLKKLNTVGRLARGEEVETELNPSIEIQIVPLEIGAYPAMRGPFELLEFDDPDDPNMVYFENPRADIVIKEGEETAESLELFLRLQSVLVPPSGVDEQIDLIIQLMEDHRNGIPTSGQSGRHIPPAA